MPQGRKKCPLCNASQCPREILRHIRDKHPSVLLTREQLDSLGARQCQTCRKVLSESGKGTHLCVTAQTSVSTQQTCHASGKLSGSRNGTVPSAPRVTRGNCSARLYNKSDKGAEQQVPQVTADNAVTTRSGRCTAGALSRDVSPEQQRARTPSQCSQGSGSEYEPEQVLRELLESPARSTDSQIDGVSASKTEQHAAQTQQEPVQQLPTQAEKQQSQHIHYAAQTVPKGTKAAFSEVAAPLACSTTPMVPVDAKQRCRQTSSDTSRGSWLTPSRCQPLSSELLSRG